MSRSLYHVLFLCTGNSARSIMAEAALSHLGAGKFKAYSAGSYPTGSPHPLALQVLREQGYEVDALRSKSWDEFSDPGTPSIDLVLTVCDNARNESCPVWPGHPITAHWGVEDPAAFEGTPEAQREVFLKVFGVLRRRVESLVALDVESLDQKALLCEIQKFGNV